MPAVTYRYQALKGALAAAVPAAGDVRRPHALAVVSGLAGNGYVSSLLVPLYLRLGAAGAARKVFDAVPRAASLSAPASTGPMACPPDRHTYHLAVTSCARASEFELGRRVGSDAAAKGFASDLLVATALVVVYSEAGDLAAARMVFDEMPHRYPCRVLGRGCGAV